jgi:hypothetical protein
MNTITHDNTSAKLLPQTAPVTPKAQLAGIPINKDRKVARA